MPTLDEVCEFRNEYDNNAHFEGVRFICGPHFVIIHICKIKESSESYARKMNIVAIITHFLLVYSDVMRCPVRNLLLTVHLYGIYVRK